MDKRLAELSRRRLLLKAAMIAPLAAASQEVGAQSNNNMPYKVYVKHDFGAKGDGISDDTSAINKAMAEAIATKQELVFEPGTYVVPNGVIDRSNGLVVSGLGYISPGPGNQWLGQGAQILTTNPGNWCWSKLPIGGNVTQYTGGKISNMGFRGNGVTAGGLLLSTGHNLIDNCCSLRHTNGVGIKVVSPPPPADAAAFQKLMNCWDMDSRIGLQIADAASAAAYSHIYNFTAVKYTSGGAVFTGYGIVSYDSETTFLGGHCEGHGIGFLSAGIGKGPMVIGMHFENNAAWDIDLTRVSGGSATRNIVLSVTSKIRIGSNQNRDMIIGGDHQYADTSNNGIGTIMVSNGIGQVQIPFTSSGVPAGGFQGEIRVQNGRLYYKDGATWKGLLGT